MEQILSVRAIIKEQGKVLLIRRAKGSSAARAKFELPGGKIEFGENPRFSLNRELEEEIGNAAEVAQLYDIISYIDENDSTRQHIIIVFLVSISAHHHIKLSDEHDAYEWRKLSEIQLNEITDTTRLALKIEENTTVTEREMMRDSKTDEKVSTSARQMIVYSDGGSRGNPGPSAAGFVVMDEQEGVLFEGGEYLGVTTNNQAEYQAVLLGLTKAKELDARKVDFRMDSLLVVNQMNGIYQIKNRDLWPIHDRIRELAREFDKVTFTHVRREFNKHADEWVNRILDERAREASSTT